MKNKASRKVVRFPVLRPAQLTPAQRKVLKSLVAGPRGTDGTGLDSVTRFLTRGPFNAFLRSPALGDLLQQVGAQIRFRSSLPPRLNEFAILITARHWTSQFEWYAHRLLALNAGLDAKLIGELARNRRPGRMRADEAAVYAFCTQLHRGKNVTDAAYRRAVALFGERGVMDLIGACGYYTLVSMTLNVARAPVPPGEKNPLK